MGSEKFFGTFQLERATEALELLLRRTEKRYSLFASAQMAADLEVGPADLIAQTESIAERRRLAPLAHRLRLLAREPGRETAPQMRGRACQRQLAGKAAEGLDRFVRQAADLRRCRLSL